MPNIFIIGLGERANTHIDILLKLSAFKIIGAYDNNQVKKSYHFPIYSNLKQGLFETQPEIILIATPPEIRYELFESFSDLSVLQTIILEKPFALSMNEGLKIADFCKEKGWHLFICHQSRFAEEFIKLKEYIDTGKIGTIRSIYSTCYGNVFDQGSHQVDIIRWLNDNSQASWVDATKNDDRDSLKSLSHFLSLNNDNNHPGNLWTSISMRFKNGVDVFMHCGVLAPNLQIEMDPWFQRRITVIGTEGMAEAQLTAYAKYIALKGSEEFKTNKEFYLQSLFNFYDTVLQNTMTESERLARIDDHINTLAVLCASYKSANQNKLIEIPESLAQLDELDYAANHPTISIIIPMDTHRSMGKKAIQSWIHQNCPQNIYEIILVFYESQHGLYKKLKKYLRAGDKAIFCRATNEIELAHRGAEAAQGYYLFFTESHCFAETDAITQSLYYLNIRKYDALYPNTYSINKNKLAQLEEKIYQIGIQDSENWNKVSLHGFILKKNLYFNLGGFNYKYQRYAYWLLSAKLCFNRYKLHNADQVKIHHLFVRNFKEFNEFLSECVTGECKFYQDVSYDDPYRELIHKPAEWINARNKRIDLVKLLFTNIFFVRQKEITLKIQLIYYKQYFFHLLTSYMNKFYLFFLHFCTLRSYRIKLFFNNIKSANAWKNYYRYFIKKQEFERIRIALSSKENIVQNEQFYYFMEKINDDKLYGFHLPEPHSSGVFRWTDKEAAVLLQLTPKNYKIKIQVLGEHCTDYVLKNTHFFIGNQKVKEISYKNNNTEIILKIKKEYLKKSNNWLMIISNYIRDAISDDTRSIGLPIQYIEVSNES